MTRLAQREWTHHDKRATRDSRTYWTDPGPWHHEPDKVQWIDQATNYACLAVRNPSGAWCGYVGVPEGHPFYRQDYDNVPDVIHNAAHGGLTFSDLCYEEAEEGHGICHIPEPGHPDNVWWLGFDCAHLGDFVPGMPRMPSEWRRQETYKDLAYVQATCEQLAAQIKEHA